MTTSDTIAGAGTRHRALEVAQQLFAENGYAGTSIADIAERLGVTKAAVYYHFRAKSDLLTELISPMFVQLQALLDDPPADSRTLLEHVVEVLAGQRDTIHMVAGDPSVLHELDSRAPMEFFKRLIDVLAGARPSATRRLRARCALGAIHAAVVGPVVEGRKSAGPGPGLAAGQRPTPMTAHERRVVVDAALAALG